eukprot:jgi/Chrzof1/6506/Cz18g13240.t1
MQGRPSIRCVESWLCLFQSCWIETPPASAPQTGAAYLRTFSDLEAWQDFVPGAQTLFQSLHNVERIYKDPSISILGRTVLRSAADESEVRSCVLNIILESVNDAAAELGSRAAITSSGSNRSASFTDLVVCLTGGDTDPDHLSSPILGVLEIKGSWQFSLKPGETLQDALHDPTRVKDILPAVQQVDTCVAA